MRHATRQEPGRSSQLKAPSFLWYLRYLPVLLLGLYVALPVHVGVDMQKERCLQDKWLYVLLEQTGFAPRKGDLVFFPREGPLAYVQADYIGKKVVGIPGDQVRVDSQGKVWVNSVLVGEGFPLSPMYRVSPEHFFESVQTIPQGQVFVMGDHPQSNDSRYWGTLPIKKIRGQMWGIF